MPFLLDTTALSELTKPTANAGFTRWMVEHSNDDVFIGAPSVGELEIGIALLAPSKKRRSLESWLERLISEFADRMLPFDVAAARIWGRAIAAGRRRGMTLPATDSQLAAIAAAHELAIVTRNVRHFEMPEFQDVQIIDPWSAA